VFSHPTGIAGAAAGVGRGGMSLHRPPACRSQVTFRQLLECLLQAALCKPLDAAWPCQRPAEPGGNDEDLHADGPDRHHCRDVPRQRRPQIAQTRSVITAAW